MFPNVKAKLADLDSSLTGESQFSYWVIENNLKNNLKVFMTYKLR